MSEAKTEHEVPVWIEGKDPRMELLSEEPLVMATPVGLLAGHRITPKESLFVRNIQDLPGGHPLEPRSLEGWEIELSGLIDPSRVVIQAEELLGMEQVE
jgi:sulfite oxidase